MLLPRLGEHEYRRLRAAMRGADEHRRRADRGEGDVGQDQERDGDARDLLRG